MMHGRYTLSIKGQEIDVSMIFTSTSDVSYEQKQALLKSIAEVFEIALVATEEIMNGKSDETVSH